MNAKKGNSLLVVLLLFRKSQLSKISVHKEKLIASYIKWKGIYQKNF